MAPEKGMIVLMGSGELTATMVEVHKELLRRFGSAAKAVFLDTPAGFQLNVDQISQKAQEYFKAHVQQPLAIASFKSNETISPFEAEQAFQTLREADFVLIGPGSPTYAVQQWQQTAIPQILTSRIREGGCLVAASAAALTVGRFTLPVYEIYKVGQDLHWADGMDIYTGRMGWIF
jgi:peptidase E